MTAHILKLERFGVAFGLRVVLASVDLEVAPRGTTVLMGPAGVGKSTLVRTLAGANENQPSLRTWGRAVYQGESVRSGPRPTLVGQGAKILVVTVLEAVVSALPDRAARKRDEQRQRATEILRSLGMGRLATRLDEPASALSRGELRCLSIAAAVAADPALLLVDEPTAGLAEDERRLVVEALARRAETHALLLVTHNRADALALPGRTALLAGGAIVEAAETATFFGAPKSPVSQVFVETGSCAVSSPPALDQLVADGLVPASFLEPPERREIPQTASWSAFPVPVLSIRWVQPGVLAGVPRPGLLGSVDGDLQTLAAAGIRLLISLEEAQVVPPALLARYGIASYSHPIHDMGAPSIDDALSLAALIDESIEAGRPVAVHCRAGLGRTGTVLAAYLIWKGFDAARALSRVRSVEPRFVQSEEQLEHLTALEDHMRRRAGAARQQP